MSSIDDKLNEVLNITPEVIEATEISTIEETQITVPQDKDAEVDFDTGRENLQGVVLLVLSTSSEPEVLGDAGEDSGGVVPFLFERKVVF